MLTLPERISDEKIKQILKKVEEGTASKEDAEELIMGKLRHAMKIASKYTYIESRHRHDIESVAIVALTSCVDNVLHRKKKIKDVEHLHKYLSLTIGRRCTEYYNHNRTPFTIRHNKLWKDTVGALNKEKQLVREIENNPDIPNDYKEEIRKLPIEYQESALGNVSIMSIKQFKIYVRDKIYELVNLPTNNCIQAKPNVKDVRDKPMSSSLELWEEIKRVINSPMEEAIVLFRYEGYSFTEIASKVGSTLSTVSRKIQDIEQRYERLTNFKAYSKGLR